MNILFWALTIGVIGKVCVVIGVLTAHDGIMHEKKIDKEVLLGFRKERIITVFGLFFILIGYGMEVYFYGFTPFLTCSGMACSSAVSAAFGL